MLVVLNLSGQVTNAVQHFKRCCPLNLLLNLVEHWNLIFAHLNAVKLRLIYLVVPSVLFDPVNFVPVCRIYDQ